MRGFAAVLAFLTAFVVVGFVSIAMGAGDADATDFPQERPKAPAAASPTPRPATPSPVVVERQEQPVKTPPVPEPAKQTPKPVVKTPKQATKPSPKTTTRTECKQIGEGLSCTVYVQRVG